MLNSELVREYVKLQTRLDNVVERKYEATKQQQLRLAAELDARTTTITSRLSEIESSLPAHILRALT